MFKKKNPKTDEIVVEEDGKQFHVDVHSSEECEEKHKKKIPFKAIIVSFVVGIIVAVIAVAVCKLAMGPSTYEGGGYDSPEKALKAYVRALGKGDLEGMAETFAIESMVENYNYNVQLEILGSTSPAFYGFIPNNGAYAETINVQTRYMQVTKNLYTQYYALTHQGNMDGFANIYSMNNYVSSQQIADELFPDYGEQFLDSVKFDEMIAADVLVPGYNEQNSNLTLMNNYRYLGAEQMQSAACIIKTADGNYYLTADFVRYGDKWYILNLGGYLGLMAGQPAACGGLMPVQ